MVTICADQIRAYVNKAFFEPARRAGKYEIEITAGEVHLDLKLNNRIPAICSALDAKKLHERFRVLLAARTGPRQSSTVKWRFSLMPQPIPTPKLPSNVGKRGKAVMPPENSMNTFTIVDEVRKFQDSSQSKIIVLQRIRFSNDRTEVRLGYYIIGKKPKMRGKWVWGQYATFMPERIFRSIFKQTVIRGWFK